MSDPDLSREEKKRIEEQTELVGKWEDSKRVPEQKRLTWFHPDFGCYVLNYYVSKERLAAAVNDIEKQQALDTERRKARKNHVSPVKRQKKQQEMER